MSYGMQRIVAILIVLGMGPIRININNDEGQQPSQSRGCPSSRESKSASGTVAMRTPMSEKP